MSGATSQKDMTGKEVNEFRLDKPRQSDKRKAEEQRRLQAELHGKNASFPGPGPKRKKSKVGRPLSSAIDS